MDPRASEGLGGCSGFTSAVETSERQAVVWATYFSNGSRGSMAHNINMALCCIRAMDPHVLLSSCPEHRHQHGLRWQGMLFTSTGIPEAAKSKAVTKASVSGTGCTLVRGSPVLLWPGAAAWITNTIMASYATIGHGGGCPIQKVNHFYLGNSSVPRVRVVMQPASVLGVSLGLHKLWAAAHHPLTPLDKDMSPATLSPLQYLSSVTLYAQHRISSLS